MRAGWGLGLVVLSVAASIAIASVQDAPASLHSLGWKLDPQRGFSGISEPPNATLSADGRPYAVAFLQVVEYNATRDATLAGTLVCSHRACGPLVWIEGRHTQLYGPWLLWPTSDTLSFEDLRPPPPPQPPEGSTMTTPTMTTPGGWGGPMSYGGIAYAIAEPFEARTAEPVAYRAGALAAAPLLLAAFAPAGLAWWKRALLVVPIAAGVWLAVQAAPTGWGMLGYLAILGPTLLISGLTLVIMAVMLKRVSPWALAVFLLAVAFFVAQGELTPYMPADGWGD